jgi:DnaK suppressor protein
MTPAEKAALKEKVQGDLEAVAQEITELEGLTQPIPPDAAIGRISRMDAINNRSINEAALRAAREKQKKLTTTLKHIDRENFGVCAKCGNTIPQGRMLLMPHATRCVQCA